MDKIYMIIMLFFIMIGIISLVYMSNANLTKQIENFTTLSGFNPLTNYDDYGTFNFIFHENDLPYFDPGFASIFCGEPDYVPGPPRKPKFTFDLGFDQDSFIDYQGFKVRRELVPSDYTKGMEYGNANFNPAQPDVMVRKDRPRASAEPPQAHNYYFSVPEREPYQPLF